MLFQGALIGLILALLAACGVMLFKVYGTGPVAASPDTQRPDVTAARQFPDALKQLVDAQLRDCPDAAIRFALQSRLDTAIPLGGAATSLALQEVLLELERLEVTTIDPDALARLGDGSHPVNAFLLQRPGDREAMLLSKVVGQLRRQLASIVGAERTALDFHSAGALPTADEDWVRWYRDGSAQNWFQRLVEQAHKGIGSARVVGLIEGAAREIGQMVPLICFPDLLAMMPDACLTSEKSYAAGRRALWNDFLQTRRSLQTSEEALRQLNDELEQRVRDRTAELERARARAEQSERAKDRFLANMSHEIRTPLHGMLGMLDLLRSSELTVAQAQQTEVMSRSGTALVGVVNDILEFSTMQSGTLALEITEYSAADIAADTISLFEPRAQIKNVAMALQLQTVPACVLGDAARLRQVLGNLVGNAVKFTERGRIDLTVRGDADHGRLHIEVSDTGIGIPESAVSRIFDPFSQADGSTRRRYGGTGLGLAISSELVKAMGGQLTVDSRTGEGSTFRFEIPIEVVEKTAAERTDAAPGSAPRPLLHLHVLLAEDNPVNQLLTRAQLSTLGCSVEIAENGEQAVRMYREGDYDIVLMDCHMPELDGYEATMAIRALERERGTGHVPIIAVTATVLDSDRALCLAAGMDDFISKPFGVQQVAAMLERWRPAHETAAELSASPSHAGSAAAAPPRITAAVPASIDTASAAAPVIDVRVFHEMRALQQGDHHNLVALVVSTFRKDAPLRVAELRAAIRAGNASRVREAAHSLKSASANCGALGLSSLCLDLESRAAAGRLDGALEAVDALDRALLDVVAALEREPGAAAG